MIPASRHDGQEEMILAKRKEVYEETESGPVDGEEEELEGCAEGLLESQCGESVAGSTGACAPAPG